MIDDFHKLTENGEKLYPDWWKSLVGIDLGANLKVDRVIAARWIHNGKSYEKKIDTDFDPIPIPDGSGLINIEKNKKEAVFYEPDLKERFRVAVPVVGAASVPDKAFFNYFGVKNIKELCSCTFNDGDDDYKCDLNLMTGEITNIKRIRL